MFKDSDGKQQTDPNMLNLSDKNDSESNSKHKNFFNLFDNLDSEEDEDFAPD